MRNHNLVGPQIRRLRSRKEWSQNDLAVKLQILGLESATRGRVSKIEARTACVADEEIIYFARVLGVTTEDLYPDFIRDAKRLYEAICTSKASRFGVVVFGLLSCSKFGAGALEFAFSVASL